jgi:hypothetical protein
MKVHITNILLGHHYILNIKPLSISMTDIMTRVLGGYKNEGTYN